MEPVSAQTIKYFNCFRSNIIFSRQPDIYQQKTFCRTWLFLFFYFNISPYLVKKKKLSNSLL